MRIRIFLIIAGTALFALGIYSFLLLKNTSYEQFILSFSDLAQVQPSHIYALEEAIPSSRYAHVLFGPIFLFLLGLMLLVFHRTIGRLLYRVTSTIGQSINKLSQIPRDEIWALVLIISILSAITIFNITSRPIYFDEALTFQDYTKRTFLASISYYPEPNNHILNSIFTNLTYHFPFSRTINLRLGNFLIYLLSLITLFYTFSRLLNSRTALIATALFGSFFSLLFYAYLSRGYIIIAFAFILGFYALMQLCYRDQRSWKYYLLWAFSGILGFYAIPTYLYPHMTSALFILGHLIMSKKPAIAWKRFIISGLITTGGVLLLYTPVFLISGIESVVSNRHVLPISRSEVLNRLFSHVEGSVNLIFGLTIYVVLLVVAYLIIFARDKKEKWFSVFCLVMLPIFCLVQSVIPFGRVWIYLSVPFAYLLALVFANLKLDRKLANKWIAMIAVLIISLQSLAFFQRVPEHDRASYWSQEIADTLISTPEHRLILNQRDLITSIVYNVDIAGLDMDVEILDREINLSDTSLFSTYDFALTHTVLPSEFQYRLVHSYADNLHFSQNKAAKK